MKMWNEKVSANEYRVSFWSVEKVLELSNGDGCTTLHVLNATELYALKWSKQEILFYMYFTTIKLKI